MLNHKSQSLVKLQNKVLYFKNLLKKEKQMYERMKQFKENVKEPILFEEENLDKNNLLIWLINLTHCDIRFLKLLILLPFLIFSSLDFFTDVNHKVAYEGSYCY